MRVVSEASARSVGWVHWGAPAAQETVPTAREPSGSGRSVEKAAPSALPVGERIVPGGRGVGQLMRAAGDCVRS